MNFKSTLLKVLAGAIIAFTIIYLTINSGTSIDVYIPENRTVNEPLKIDVEVSKNLQAFTPETLDLKFYNKYNKDESLHETLQSYDTGKYSIIVTPNYEGTYVLEVNISNDGKNYAEQQTFEVTKDTE